jgi:hypothetical protein
VAAIDFLRGGDAGAQFNVEAKIGHAISAVAMP